MLNMAGSLHALLFIALMSSAAICCRGSFQLPLNTSALIFFGDSILDAGNNDYILISLAKADHYPYGIDFPRQSATGRWSNGLIIPDMLAGILGLESPLPYLDRNARGAAILRGINMASGGSGLLNITLQDQNVFPLSKQMTWYANYRDQLEQIVGANRAAAVLSSAFHLISSGTNDYILSYYLNPGMRARYNISEFRAMLLQNYQDNLKELYVVGGRNVAIVGVPPMGCIPTLRTLFNGTQGCFEDLNLEALAFNEGLQSLLSTLGSSLDGFKLTYVDSYHAALQILQRSEYYGFTETTRGCCGDGILSVGPTCLNLSPACTNRSEYFFFDCVHPTQRVYEIVTNLLFVGK